MATDLAGEETWLGPFEPFGRDYLMGTQDGALDNGLFLRLPGQWDDGRWAAASLGADLYYNVHRWFEYQTGRYGRVDPDFLVNPSDQPRFGYSLQNPLRLTDPLGLKIHFAAPELRRFFNCAALHGRPEFFYAQNWIWHTRQKYEVDRLTSRRTVRARSQLQFKAPAKGSFVDPTYNIIFIDDRDPSCENIVGDITREITEIYANKVKNLSADN